MSKRRNRFDIAMPPAPMPDVDTPGEETALPSSAPAPGPARRGPMATAVGEAAESARARQAMEESIRAENDALAHELVRLRGLGLVVAEVPLDAVDAGALTRDRRAGEDAELPELVTSIREVGLSNPIQVAEAGAGRYALIQGFRRLSAYRALRAEEGEAWAAIPAVVLPKGETLAARYRRMVDENLVRSDISFAEMGALARAYAADPETACDGAEDAVAVLFRSAGYQKRTYIRGFARLMEAIGGALSHPEAISRNLGLAVLKRLEAEPETRGALVAALSEADEATAEQGVLSTYAAGQGAAKATPARKKGRAKTTFRLDTGQGEIRCTAAPDRFELSGGPDFSTYDRDCLERAVAVFLAALEKE